MSEYTLLNSFVCCGKPMVAVIMKKSKSVSIMEKWEYDTIVRREKESH